MAEKSADFRNYHPISKRRAVLYVNTRLLYHVVPRCYSLFPTSYPNLSYCTTISPLLPPVLLHHQNLYHPNEDIQEI